MAALAALRTLKSSSHRSPGWAGFSLAAAPTDSFAALPRWNAPMSTRARYALCAALALFATAAFADTDSSAKAPSVAALNATPAGIDPDCDYLPADLPELDIEQLQEVVFEGDCRSLESAAAERLQTRLDAPPALEPELDAEEQAEGERELERTRFYLAALRTAQAMQRGDVHTARLQLDHYAELMTRHEAEDPESLQAGLKYVDEIRAVLEHRAARVRPLDPAAPRPDWTLGSRFCGTARALLDWHLRGSPNVPAAWIAIGEPEAAVHSLLNNYWLDAIEEGVAPPMLREYSELAFGPGSYADAVGQALAGVWIEQGPLGRHAWLPLFGRRLPVPVAAESVRGELSTQFDSSAALREWLRPLLLPAQ
jgi:hypothetical protein